MRNKYLSDYMFQDRTCVWEYKKEVIPEKNNMKEVEDIETLKASMINYILIYDMGRSEKLQHYTREELTDLNSTQLLDVYTKCVFNAGRLWFTND